MLLGFFTPTEIASVTVLYAVLISSLFYRELTWQGVLSAAFETIRASAGILLIVAVAALFGWILSVEAVPQQLTGMMLVDLDQSVRPAADRQRPAAPRRHVPRQHHGDPGHRADHREAAGRWPASIPCTSGWSSCST